MSANVIPLRDPVMAAYDRLLAEWHAAVSLGAPDVDRIKRLAVAAEEFERVYCPGGRNA